MNKISDAGTMLHLAHMKTVSEAGQSMQYACHSNAVGRGWWLDARTGDDVRTWPKESLKVWVNAKLALVQNKLSISRESYSTGEREETPPHRPMFESELAVAVIRCFDLAGGLGYDLGAAIAAKLAAAEPEKAL